MVTETLHENSSKAALCLQQAEKIHWSEKLSTANMTW